MRTRTSGTTLPRSPFGHGRTDTPDKELRGKPGYAPHLDRDDDGVACE
ncbi:excalibur calcium-binding domain-containing protein [Nocardia abscessus]